MSRPANIYEFLDDDSNEKVQKGPVTQQQKPKTAPQTKPSQPKANTQQVNRAPARNQDRKPREEGKFNDSPISDRKPRAPRQPKGGEFTEVRAPRNPNQRQYDRKSGTGRGRENKRAGGGRGNWGSVTDETKNTEEQPEKTETQEAAPAEATTTEATTEPAAETKVEEEEENVKTLDEYLNTIKKVNISLPAPRQAGEGQQEDKKWASYVPLKKDSEEEEKQKSEKKKAEAKESGKQTISADQIIHFKESPKGGFRGGRGGRREGGSPRGGSPRGGRGGRRGTSARAPGLTEDNFPALKA